MDAIFVTSTYPFGVGETFIENEIEFLAKSFEHVFIYPCDVIINSNTRLYPENVLINTYENTASSSEKYSVFFDERVYRECCSQVGRKEFPGRCASALYLMRETKRASRHIDKFLDDMHLQKGSHVVIYSYWLSHIGMTALNIKQALKKRGIGASAVSRCHGYDLYEDRAYRNYLPFQEYLLSKFNRIYPCSQNGTEYLKKKYPQYSDKIETAYLGIPDRFKGKWPTKEPFNIVSCSSVNEVKRVIKIAEAFREIKDIPVHWTHFGDGPLFEQLKESVRTELPENITVDLLGRVDNSDIYRYYQENNVSLFVNVSSSEGLPVSIMEACSFGIPVVATDVGGTSEIVENEKNGYLLKRDFELNALVKAIISLYSMERKYYESLCRNSRKIYLDKFAAEENYCEFISRIQK